MHVITGLGTGGAERMLAKLVCAGDQQHFEPVVVSLTNEGTLGQLITACGIDVHVIGMRQGRGSFVGLLKLALLIKRLKPDLIMAWMYHANIAAMGARTLVARNTPVLWNIRHTPCDLGLEKRLTAALIRLGARLSAIPARVVYNSRISRGRHEQLGFRKGNSVVIPNGFDTGVFKPSVAARLRTRAALGIPENALVLGHVARFHPMKDHEGFLYAASIVAAKTPDAWFVLAGRDVSPRNSILSGWVKSLGLQDRVMLLDERDDLPDLLPALDVLCLSSAWGEGFPNIIGEAMACCVPCVTTDVGDAGMIVGDSGRVVPPCDKEAFAGACLDLLSLGSETRQALGGVARQRIVSDFSIDAVVTRYESLYGDVLNSL